MTRKFSQKTYQGKDRIYRPVPGATGILRLWVWDKGAAEYRTPSEGKLYDARRYEPNVFGGKTRVKRYFATLDEARAWQNHLRHPASDADGAADGTPKTPKGPTFREIYEAFLAKKVSVLSKGTQANYARYIRLYFQDVLPMNVHAISPQFIDNWIDWLRATRSRFPQSRQRTNFDHELSVMRSILQFYGNYYDDPTFRLPMKSRHAEDSRIRKSEPKLKDLTEAEFRKFRDVLAKQKLGHILAPMATVQFYEALRISEAAGLFFEDLNLNFRQPQDSTIRVCRHVYYPRDEEGKMEILPGFKNAGGGDRSVKELYLFPEAFEALKSVFKVGARGLIFGVDAKMPLTYRQIQSAYDQAFHKAGLPYRGTHVLRHGGCRRVYNATGGDLALAQQLLGNSDLQSTLVYAQRDKGALKSLVADSWRSNLSRS